MRSYLRFLTCASVACGAAWAALALPSSGCARDLWGGYVHDTEDSCTKVPCTNGGTCNINTGFCEGGMDMGSVDMGPVSRGDLFKEPVALTLSSSLDAQTFYQMAATVPNQRGDTPELYLSGTGRNLTRLFPSGGVGSYSPTTTDVMTQPGYLTSILASDGGKRDVLSAQLTSFYWRITGSAGMATQLSTSPPGFKLLSVGELDDDAFPDIVVSSSLLKLGAAVYGAFPMSTSDGSSAVHIGNNNYALAPLNGPSLANKLISASVQFKNDKGRSGFNLGLISEDKTMTAVLVQLTPNGGSYTITPKLELPIPASDFALPVDLDQDGLNDLILAQLWDGSQAFSGPLGAVRVLYNAGSQNSPDFPMIQREIVATAATPILGVHIDDFDQDGMPDLAVLQGSASGGDILLFHNEAAASGSTMRRQLRSIGKVGAAQAARSVEFVDANRDGCKDMLMLFSGSVSGGTGTKLLLALGKKNRPGMPDCQ